MSLEPPRRADVSHAGSAQHPTPFTTNKMPSRVAVDADLTECSKSSMKTKVLYGLGILGMLAGAGMTAFGVIVAAGGVAALPIFAAGAIGLGVGVAIAAAGAALAVGSFLTVLYLNDPELFTLFKLEVKSSFNFTMDKHPPDWIADPLVFTIRETDYATRNH